MARRRSPHPSSADFEDEESIPILFSNPHNRGQGPSQPSLLATSLKMKRTLLRCRGRVQNHSGHSDSFASRWKIAACFVAAAIIVFIKPFRLLNSDAGRSHYLRAQHDVAHGDNHTVPSDDVNTLGDHGHDSQNELLQALYQLSLPTTYEELDALNEEFVDLDPRFILKWAHHFLTPPHLVQVTSFGPTGLVILHMLYQSKLLVDVPVITMDTLHLFPESYQFYDTLRSYYRKLEGSGQQKMDLIITKPLRIDYPPEMNGDGVLAGFIESRREFDAQYGPNVWKTDREKFTKLTKIDPMNKELDRRQVQMWITGRRRSSGGERADMDVLEFEPLESSLPDRSSNDGTHAPFHMSRGRWKLNPLAYWTYDQVWRHIREHKLPYNVLYDKGYTSLGDEMTTGLPKLKTVAGEVVDRFERSGRFVGSKNNECGLHSHREKVKRQKQEAGEAGEEFTAPVLACEKCVDLTVDNFERGVTMGEEGHELLVEFYSPYCGGCQEFAPTLDRLANHISSNVPNLKVVRFDITENEIPKINEEELFKVEATPTLYRVLYLPAFRVELYEGEHDFESILRWATEG